MTRRLVVSILMVSLTVLVLAIAGRAWERQSALASQSAAAKSNTAVRIGASCGAAVWQFDDQALDTILRSELLDNSLISVRIFQNESDTIAWLTRLPTGKVTQVTSAPVGNYDTRNFPIHYSGNGGALSLQATVSLWFDDSFSLSVLISDLVWNILVVVFIVVTLTLLLAFSVLRQLVRPLEFLRSGMIEAAESSSRGANSPSIRDNLPKAAFPELERMASDLDVVFSTISSAISQQKSTEAKIQNLNENLESLVLERTEELAHTNRELSETLESLKRVQDELVNSAQLAVLGRLVATIAHELNTPLGAIVSSNSSVLQGLADLGTDLLPFFASLGGPEREFLQALVASAAHRTFPLDTPEDRLLKKRYVHFFETHGGDDPINLADILVETGYRTDERGLDYLVGLKGYSEVIEAGGKLGSLLLATRIVGLATEKASKFVTALKTYSRSDDGDDTQEVDVIASLETVLLLFQHEIKLGVKVEKDFQNVPLVRCRHEGIQQVWTNLIGNAFHAMGHRGTLTLKVFEQAPWVVVSVQDSGSGIPVPLQGRIFTPFFTTKKPGEGTGLGLDIARRIVMEGGGNISFESSPGHTVFQVRLPVSPVLP